MIKQECIGIPDMILLLMIFCFKKIKIKAEIVLSPGGAYFLTNVFVRERKLSFLGTLFSKNLYFPKKSFIGFWHFWIEKSVFRTILGFSARCNFCFSLNYPSGGFGTMSIGIFSKKFSYASKYLFFWALSGVPTYTVPACFCTSRFFILCTELSIMSISFRISTSILMPFLYKTSRERPKSVSYLWLKKSKRSSKYQVFSFTVPEWEKIFGSIFWSIR